MSLTQLKHRIRDLPWVYAANARWKSLLLKREYKSTLRYYSDKPAPGDAAALLEKRGGERLARFRQTDWSQRAPRIFFLGTDEFQDRGGTLQSLERLGELEYFTQADGYYGQNDPGTIAQKRRNNSRRLLELFENLKSQGRTPDILVGQTWGEMLDPPVLGEIKERYGTLLANICWDDRHMYWGKPIDGIPTGMRAVAPYFDVILTSGLDSRGWYLKEGVAAIFWPEGSDPALFHPDPGPKLHDVGFVGAAYGIRKKLVDAITRSGVTVTAYGNGWPAGRKPVPEMIRLFQRSRIILGVGTIGHSEEMCNLKLRDFDAPMTGSFYLTTHNEDLDSVYEVGREIATYRSIPDCVEKIRYYLEHEQEREEVARRGLQRALRDHTWDVRFRTMLRFLQTGQAARSG